jgi:large subunit ribosomal protein L23
MALFSKKKDDKKDDKQEDKKVEKKESMKKLYEKEQLKKEIKAKKSDSKYLGAYRVLVKPLVTEKATALGSENKYIFVIDNKANKLEVVKAIWSVYGVKPIQVNIIRMKGKRVSRGKIRGKRKDWKKAIITLKPGEQIKVYEGV